MSDAKPRTIDLLQEQYFREIMTFAKYQQQYHPEQPAKLQEQLKLVSKQLTITEYPEQYHPEQLAQLQKQLKLVSKQLTQMTNKLDRHLTWRRQIEAVTLDCVVKNNLLITRFMGFHSPTSCLYYCYRYQPDNIIFQIERHSKTHIYYYFADKPDFRLVYKTPERSPILIGCWGCRENQPNQAAHVDPGGCLYDGPSLEQVDLDPRGLQETQSRQLQQFMGLKPEELLQFFSVLITIYEDS